MVDVVSAAEVPRIVLGEFRITSFGLFWPKMARRLPEYDIVNLHGPVPTMSDLFLLLNQFSTRVRRPRIIYTHHSAIEINGLEMACAVYNRIHDGLAQTADRIIVSSKSYRDLLARPVGPPVDVVPWGVDSVDEICCVPHQQSSEGPLRVLFVGQMRPYKGIDTLLRAVAGQRAITLTLIGSGALFDQYRSLAAAIGATNVTFVGRISDSDLLAHYRSHDVVALPSTTRAEAFGLVLLEGMASGCVPVASDLPGVRDVASPTGFVVPPRDPEALRQVFLSMAADPGRLHHLQQASREAAAHMAWDRVVERYERAFVETVAGWHVRQARRSLPSAWANGRVTLRGLVDEFDASWASLLLFRRRPVPRVLAAWGNATSPELRRNPPRVPYISVTGRPQFLDRTSSDSPLRGLLRADVHSAMSVPFPCRAGTTGVVILSLASSEQRAFTPYDLERLVRRMSSGQNGKLRRPASQPVAGSHGTPVAHRHA